jgi:formylglycine-generating enzyme required for sulfatase activity
VKTIKKLSLLLAILGTFGFLSETCCPQDRCQTSTHQPGEAPFFEGIPLDIPSPSFPRFSGGGGEQGAVSLPHPWPITRDGPGENGVIGADLCFPSGAVLHAAIHYLVHTVTNSLGQTFVLIPPGTFHMGSPSDETGRDDDERRHQVTLTTVYFLQTTEVTQAEWETVMGYNPAFFAGCPDCPVESVSWDEVQEFINRMNMRGEGTYRLPTEAEWEYACRAGSTTRFSWGDEADCSMANYGNYWSKECEGINPGRTLEVKSFPPNGWGLYDMVGNVWERCQDWYESSYPAGDVTDPTGPSKGTERVDRGGAWNYYARGCRSANRAKSEPHLRTPLLGFRLAWEPSAWPHCIRLHSRP